MFYTSPNNCHCPHALNLPLTAVTVHMFYIWSSQQYLPTHSKNAPHGIHSPNVLNMQLTAFSAHMFYTLK